MALPLADRRDPALAKRIVSGAVLVVLALVILWLGGWPFALLVAAAAAAMGWEWAGLLPQRIEPHGVVPALVIPAPVLAVLVCAGGDPRLAILVLAVGAVIAAACLSWSGRRGADHVALGVVYVGLPTVTMVWLDGRQGDGPALVLWLLLIVWATDIFAYLFGRSVGGPKLAPRISPGKTWSGLIGGVAGAAVVGAVASAALGGRVSMAAGLAVLLAVVSQVGDLFESFMKRRAGVKDSGQLIPGHGGVLDRLDGLMLAAPAYALFVAALPGGTLP